MTTTAGTDGYRLWYDAVGEGTAIIFPVRFRAETQALGSALANGHRIVRYKPREAVGVLEPEDEAGGDWDPAATTSYPADLAVADLHAVADAAGVSVFVLAGYSGMAALASFLAPLTHRAAGLMVGGFPLLSDRDYWRGFVEGARAALQQAGLLDKAAGQHLGVLFYRAWADRDDTAALTALPGPKILWYGTEDSEPGCRMYEVTGGAATAHHIGGQRERLREAGFELIAIEGQDHVGALAATAEVAPRLAAALKQADWKLSTGSAGRSASR
ncbi:MAG TPA: hypothetical protein VGH27_05715 [Streptosporangiaceae bacterium]|jgi:pimeloyl-ACP methyl ester carboxylesterase